MTNFFSFICWIFFRLSNVESQNFRYMWVFVWNIRTIENNNTNNKVLHRSKCELQKYFFCNCISCCISLDENTTIPWKIRDLDWSLYYSHTVIECMCISLMFSFFFFCNNMTFVSHGLICMYTICMCRTFYHNIPLSIHLYYNATVFNWCWRWNCS